MLASAASTAVIFDALQAVENRDGATLDGQPHPVLVELRRQRLTLGRLIAALRRPVDEERSHEPTHTVLGFYGPRSVS